MVATDAPGRRVGARYRLEALIGQGGMAQVWRATDTTLDRVVALKLLLAPPDDDRELTQLRFLREARLAGSAHHPNVVQVLDFGTDEGRPFMVMEILDGESFEERLARPPALPLEQLASILEQTLEGLAMVHELGVVHRDIKPANIFLSRAPNATICPKLLDFGISRAIPGGPSGRHSRCRTREGYFTGTPEYMSPEQARNLPTIGTQTDIFSIGVVLYEALTGRLPFEAPFVGDLLFQIARREAPSVHDLRPELGQAISEVVARAMRKDAADRWSGALEMRDALKDAVTALTRSAPRVVAGPPPAIRARPPASAIHRCTTRHRAAPDLASHRSAGPTAATLDGAPAGAPRTDRSALDAGTLLADPSGAMSRAPVAPRTAGWTVSLATVVAGFVASALVMAAAPQPDLSGGPPPRRAPPAVARAVASTSAPVADVPAVPVVEASRAALVDRVAGQALERAPSASAGSRDRGASRARPRDPAASRGRVSPTLRALDY